MTAENYYLICCFAIYIAAAAPSPGNGVPDFEAKFSQLKAKYHWNYKNADEDVRRKNICRLNLEAIERHNSKNGNSYKLAPNELCVLTQEEFVQQKMGLVQKKSSGRVKRAGVWSPISSVPTSWKAGNYNLSTSKVPIKDQAQCGSCWAFTGTGVLEYFYFNKTGTYTPLSEQNMVDCQTLSGGCNGGWPTDVFDYYLANGQDYSSVYPYISKAGNCAYKNVSLDSTYGKSPKVTPAPKNWYLLSSSDENLMAYAVNQRNWLSVAVDASTWQFYAGGIMTAADCKVTDATSINHAVTIVGYGTSGTTPYWIVRNSWGTGWGEQGYIRLVRGTNTCNIASAYSDRSYLA